MHAKKKSSPGIKFSFFFGQSNEAAQEHLPTINQLILEQGAHERAAKDTAIEYDVEKVWLQAVLPSFTLVSVSGVDIDMMWVPNEPPNVVATKRIVEVVCERRTFEGIQWEGRLQKRFVMDHTRGSWPVSIAVFDGLVYVSKRNRIFILTDWPDLTLSDMRVFNDEVAITCISVDATNIYLVDHETNRVFAPPRGGGLSSTLLIQDASLKSIRGIAVSNAVVFIVAGTNEVSLYNKNTGCWLHKFVVASAINTRKLSSVAVFKNEVFVLDVEFNEILVLAFLTGRVLRILDIESDQHMLIGHIAVDQSSIFVPVGETVQQLNKQTGKLVKSYEANPDVSFHGVACGQRRVYACDQLNAVSSIS